MSEQIESQKQLIAQLAELVHVSAADGYDEAFGEFTAYVGDDDESFGVQQMILYYMSGKEFSVSAAKIPGFNVVHVVADLYFKMKEHTGGEFHSFTITIDSNGRVTTKFKYED